MCDTSRHYVCIALVNEGNWFKHICVTRVDIMCASQLLMRVIAILHIYIWICNFSCMYHFLLDLYVWSVYTYHACISNCSVVLVYPIYIANIAITLINNCDAHIMSRRVTHISLNQIDIYMCNIAITLISNCDSHIMSRRVTHIV